MKKVLFINPTRGMRAHGFYPHLGQAYLAAMLRENNHSVAVLDYNGKEGLVSYHDYIARFQPDVIGLTAYTPSWSASDNILEELQQYEIPILLGGPHVSCYFDDLSSEGKVDYLISGEAEDIICGLVESAVIQRKSGKPVRVEAGLPDVKALPLPDFTVFEQYRDINAYPLVTSRGCPFNCSFCAIGKVASKKWRVREVDSCIEEIKHAVKIYPKLERIVINDDNFTNHLPRAKEFLEKYITLGLDHELEVSNIRADRCDRELLRLLKKARCFHLGLGVEHADREVYEFVNKGEKFDAIEQAAKMIKEEGMKLSACMVIGLPKDSWKKTQKSIRFIKKMKADMVIWSLMHPFKGTSAYDWFNANGTLYEGEQCFAPGGNSLRIDEPMVETPEFTRTERKKAYLAARLATGTFSFRQWSHLIKVMPEIARYNLWRYLVTGFFYGLNTRLNREIRYFKNYYLPKSGLWPFTKKERAI